MRFLCLAATCLAASLLSLSAAAQQPVRMNVTAGHPSVTFVEHKDQMVDQVLPHLKTGDLVMTLGAGDIWKTGIGLLARLTPIG